MLHFEGTDEFVSDIERPTLNLEVKEGGESRLSINDLQW